MAKGGPDGGDGGHGGDVGLVADHTWLVARLPHHPHRRPPTRAGKGKGKHGAGEVTPRSRAEGTVVRDLEGASSLTCRTKATAPRRQGRPGGRGNARFLSNKRRAPSFAEQGEVGEERWLNLELKLLATSPGSVFPTRARAP